MKPHSINHVNINQYNFWSFTESSQHIELTALLVGVTWRDFWTDSQSSYLSTLLTFNSVLKISDLNGKGEKETPCCRNSLYLIKAHDFSFTFAALRKTGFWQISAKRFVWVHLIKIDECWHKEWARTLLFNSAQSISGGWREGVGLRMMNARRYLCFSRNDEREKINQFVWDWWDMRGWGRVCFVEGSVRGKCEREAF